MGGIIGAEREYHGREAGLRTQLLVALGACLAMVVSLHSADVYGWESRNTAFSVDPSRVAYGVMTGIGFLGAGSILRYGTGIRGLTTAASLWCTAALGLACGFGMFAVALITTGIVLFSLVVLSRLDHVIPARKFKTVVLALPSAPDTMDRVQGALAAHEAKIVDFEVVRNLGTNRDRLTLHLSIPSRKSAWTCWSGSRICRDLQRLRFVSDARTQVQSTKHRAPNPE